MNKLKKSLYRVFVVFCFGLIPALVCQLFIQKPVDRYIHIKSFRYGKDPSVIRCNRGDRIHMTFSTDDTGHSFYLEEFDMDVKVSPARKEVEVFKVSDPTKPSIRTREYTFTAKHTGVYNYLISKSNFRCHVWCGPMHAFEQGKIILFPNTLLWFSLGAFIGILFLGLISIGKPQRTVDNLNEEGEQKSLIFSNKKFPEKLLASRWPQTILMLFAMMMIYLVILTSILGTQMSGRNLGVLLMWAIWLFLLVAILTPLLGRFWCTICPLPVIGDMFQRKSYFNPIDGTKGKYRNAFSGFFLTWPATLKNNWLRLFVFLMLATFSTTLVAKPRVSGITVLLLLLVPTIMSMIWELRAFCRYVCPVSVFVGAFSRMSPVILRNKSDKVCEKCKSQSCQNGNTNGWACPYGLLVPDIKGNADCGLCLECMRSCSYKNVTLYKRPFAHELKTKDYSEAWLTLTIFTLAFVYSVLYEGHWPWVRDYVNILDKGNWALFGIYTLLVWSLSLIIVPGLVYLASVGGNMLAKQKFSKKELFLSNAGVFLPLGLMLWIAFVIPMFFVNATFILQSLSDPFGWGWDFFGTANIPWHQLWPQYIPWLQMILVLIGYSYSLKNLIRTWRPVIPKSSDLLLFVAPVWFLISLSVILMLLFFTN